ncbi:MAG: Nif3-like dinuclear metal center hexameric protein [Armatimonadetes bacterium]|nr:Nif3-like dinuclear metal center hexameric protein [Armatimonadota bacterium]
MRLSDLIHACEVLAPESLAEEWDSVGLQTGSPGVVVSRVLLALDATAETLAEARAAGAQCLLTHHPLIFRPLRSLREDRPEGRLLAALVRDGIALYVAHTNLDLARPGTSDALADALGIEKTRALVPAERPVGERRFKLAVFVPTTDAEGVRAAMGDAGAGAIGNYSHCSFSAPGTGSFRPLAGAHPAIGTVGAQERVAEEKVEALVPARLLPRVVAAMLAAHPYEEVAYDIYPLAPPPSGAGLGRVGSLADPCSLAELVGRARERLSPANVAVMGDPARRIERVAVCGGSGGDLVDAAASAGADALLTGDVKHHQALRARDLGLAVVDASHYATERPVLDLLAARLREALPAEVEIQVSTVNTDPFRQP